MEWVLQFLAKSSNKGGESRKGVRIYFLAPDRQVDFRKIMATGPKPSGL